MYMSIGWVAETLFESVDRWNQVWHEKVSYREKSRLHIWLLLCHMALGKPLALIPTCVMRITSSPFQINSSQTYTLAMQSLNLLWTPDQPLSGSITDIFPWLDAFLLQLLL